MVPGGKLQNALEAPQAFPVAAPRALLAEVFLTTPDRFLKCHSPRLAQRRKGLDPQAPIRVLRRFALAMLGRLRIRNGSQRQNFRRGGSFPFGMGQAGLHSFSCLPPCPQPLQKSMNLPVPIYFCRGAKPGPAAPKSAEPGARTATRTASGRAQKILRVTRAAPKMAPNAPATH